MDVAFVRHGGPQSRTLAPCGAARLDGTLRAGPAGAGGGRDLGPQRHRRFQYRPPTGGRIRCRPAPLSPTHPTRVPVSAKTTIGGWTFNPGASNYNFATVTTLEFNGAGIAINSGSVTVANNPVWICIPQQQHAPATPPSTTSYLWVFVGPQQGRQRDHHQPRGPAIPRRQHGRQRHHHQQLCSAILRHQPGRQRHHHQQRQSAISSTTARPAPPPSPTTRHRAILRHQQGRQRHHHQQVALLKFTTPARPAAPPSPTTASSHEQFLDTSTAGSATITNNGGSCISSTPARPAPPPSPTTAFCNSSTAARPATPSSPTTMFWLSPTAARPATPPSPTTVICYSSTPARPAAPPSPTTTLCNFVDSSTAGSATITNNVVLAFLDTSTAGSASITNNRQFNSSKTARAAARASSTAPAAPSIYRCSHLPASRRARLRARARSSSAPKNLAVGGNDLSTTFAGVSAGRRSVGGTAARSPRPAPAR